MCFSGIDVTHRQTPFRYVSSGFEGVKSLRSQHDTIGVLMLWINELANDRAVERTSDRPIGRPNRANDRAVDREIEGSNDRAIGRLKCALN